MRALLTALLLFPCTIAFAQDDTPKSDTPAEKKQKDEDGLPNYELAEDASLQETIDFLKQLNSFRPTNRQEALTHRAKGSVAARNAIEKLVKMAEAENKTDLPEYLEAKRAMLQQGISSARGNLEKSREALKAIVAFLKGREKVDSSDARLAVMSCYYYSNSGDDSDEGQALYANVAKVLKRANTDEAKDAVERVEGLARRAVLIGSEVSITGTKLDGVKFDLKSLRGKVVLVDFWATWCGPCLREHPNIVKNYEKYHDLGFEVVGISLDRNRGQLEKHVDTHETPWIILHEEGGTSDAATRYGVIGIPSMFLLNAEGKVVSTTARGPKLGAELAKLLGEPKAATKEKDGAEDGAE